MAGGTVIGGNLGQDGLTSAFCLKPPHRCAKYGHVSGAAQAEVPTSERRK
jgi:hypothetical protein